MPFFHRHFRKQVLALSLAAISGTLPVAAMEHQHDTEQTACGHAEHDTPQLRAQAGTRIYWEDPRAANPAAWVRFKILGFNDFHGQLESRRLYDSAVGGYRPVGGAAVLASYLAAETNDSANGAFIVHAGDHVGASPPISALLQDEPSISFLNLLANQYCRADQSAKHKAHQWEKRFNPRCNLVGTVGNHEFDEGVDEMMRLINGGQHPDGPFLDADYRGANFPYIAANVVDAQTGKPILPPYVIKRVQGQPVAFIGAVLKETPNIVTPSGVAGVRFLDEATAINHYARELKRQGVRAIVVTIHQGTSQQAYSGPTGPEPTDIGGSIGPIIHDLDDEIDIVVSGHWHRFTNALVSNKNGKLMLVTQAFARSTAYADIDVAIDPASKDIVAKSSEIVTTWADAGPGLQPNPAVADLVSAAADRVAPLVNRVIGTAATAIRRTENAAGESALGNLIADAQRAAMGTDIAFMNPGGIRADLDSGEITWGELFTVQPFNNDLVKMDLTGQQIVNLLNQQWAGQDYPKILKTSGLSYTWQENDPASFSDNTVDVNSIRVNGTRLNLNATYSVTVNSFMAGGGDRYTVLTEGTNRVTGPVDLDALINYIESLPQPFTAEIEGRIQSRP